MAFSFVICSHCNREFLKDNRHINENKKFGYRFYCSIKCQLNFKNKQVEFTCQNVTCKKRFKKQLKRISPNNYCSRSCAVTVNNTKFPKTKAVIRKCMFCKNSIVYHRKYCCSNCKSNALTISKERVIERIRDFYREHQRIPVKREIGGIYKPARKYFGTWNNAIEAAGFEPNQVMFANHQIANDGHICDSLAEKLIDDFLSGRKIIHQRNVSYPEGRYTADFKIGNKFIEYFGLTGELTRYDEHRVLKQKIAKRRNLKLIEIYPKDLYPHNKLEKILNI